MTQKHEPLAYGYEKDNEGGFYYIGPENQQLAIVAYLKNTDPDKALDWVQFIVRSCNSHYDLIEALRIICSEALNQKGEGYEVIGLIASAAIAKAKGVQ